MYCRIFHKSYCSVLVTDDKILETDELLPVAGKDEVYDKVMCEIEELEKELDAQLKKFEKKLG
jgi:DNA mismatch repair protein MSH6